MKAEDRLEDGVRATGGAVDPAPILGTWYATDKKAGGLIQLSLERSEDDRLVVHALGECTPEPCDWGSVEAVPYGSDILATEGRSFVASFDFDFMEVLLTGYEKKGVLVLDTFNSFKDGSGRAPYFTREFFHR